jgi:POT family proton-dependent oligopeptide transporter
MTFWKQAQSLTQPFWVANIMEMIERLAYYGVRVVIPIYIAQADEIGGLHFTQADKGLIFMWWALTQSALPVFTGGFADRYGYKQQIAVAIGLKIVGYLIMATQREFWPFLAGCLVLAAGTAIFKPPVQGTFVKTLNAETSGVGWGFFYMVVNIGGFLGPPLAHFLSGISWPTVFYGCAVLVSLNLFWLLSYPEVDSGADRSTNAREVAMATVRNLLQGRLLLFLLIASVFWAVLNQLWDMLPNFIVDWTNSATVAIHLPDFFLSRDTSRGPQLAQEWIINLNPFLIILLVAPLSWYVNHYMRRLTAIFFGCLITSLGIYLAGLSMSIFLCLAGIGLFSVGEMLCSPKMTEYLGVIAPSDQKALYMGYANIPLAIGWGIGSFVGGHIYEQSGEKAGLALRYLAEVLQVKILPERSQAFATLTKLLDQSPAQVTRLLWDIYHPNQVWLPFVAAGLLAAGALLIFNHFAQKKWQDINA